MTPTAGWLNAHPLSARKGLWARPVRLVRLVRLVRRELLGQQAMRVPQDRRARPASPGQQALRERRGLLVLRVLLVEPALLARQESPGRQALRVLLAELAPQARSDPPDQQVLWVPPGLPEPLALRVLLVVLALQEWPGQQALQVLLAELARQARSDPPDQRVLREPTGLPEPLVLRVGLASPALQELPGRQVRPEPMALTG